MNYLLTKLSDPGFEYEGDAEEVEQKILKYTCRDCKEEAFEAIRLGSMYSVVEEVLGTTCGCEFYLEVLNAKEN